MKPLYSLIALSTLLLASTAFAGVGKISSPLVTKGEFEVEYTGVRYGDDAKSLNNKQGHTYEVEYGFTDRFMLGLEGKSERESGGRGQRFEGYGLEAQYELTTQGSWWLDSAIKAEYLHTPRSAEADEAEIKLLAARSYGASSLVLNLNLERELGNNRERGIGVGTAMVAKHRYNEHLIPGIEWHADFGKLDDLGREDAHYIGPMLSGELFDVAGHEVEYNIGHFWGLTDDSADHATRLQISYGIAF